MPYTYTITREARDTGMPLMRALWLHYPDDPEAVKRGDEYLVGPRHAGRARDGSCRHESRIISPARRLV